MRQSDTIESKAPEEEVFSDTSRRHFLVNPTTSSPRRQARDRSPDAARQHLNTTNVSGLEWGETKYGPSP